VFAVVLTGPPGAGKTSVLTALVDALSDDDIAHATVEVEMLVWTHPAVTDEQWARHVRSSCELHWEAGHRLLLVAQTLEIDADVAGLLAAVAAHESSSCGWKPSRRAWSSASSSASPPGWSGLSGLVEHVQELAGTMPALGGVDLVLSTEGERAENVAATGWLCVRLDRALASGSGRTTAPSSGQQPQGAVRSKPSRLWRQSWSARRQISPASIGHRPPARHSAAQ
jgi:hypothetical protein